MDAYYATKMAAKSELELMEYFNNHDKYVPEAVLAAVAELQNRGRTFTEAELATLEPERQALRQAAIETATTETESEVETADLPALYSPGAIFGFSIFFSLIFGAALLAINVRQIGNRKASWGVIGFCVVYMFLEAVILYQLKLSSGMSVAFNLVGAVILNFYFWPKYIGIQQPYEAKPIWRALIISILIVLPLLIIVAMFPPK